MAKSEKNEISQRQSAHRNANGSDYKLRPSKRLKNAWRKAKADGSELSLRQYAKETDSSVANQWLASKL